ncbi:helix-turn-helix domain-containing protein [Roseovarius sp. D22-M7]|uniref:helix-turn-helix domain-containing protein n=1 Tax=Roseovarius sp. D22-M7 TaxID=3127116 RepID=UPI0030100FC9
MADQFTIGTRIRDRRLQTGIRQSALARHAGISASYLNLIEHNRRKIGGKTLLKLAEALEVEPALLSEGADAALVATLQEAAADSGRHDADLDHTEEFAERFPGWARVLGALHERNQTLERTVETLTDRLSHDPFLADSLHEVISAVTSIRATSSILVDTEALEPEWQARFHRNINEDSTRLTEGAQVLVRYLEGAANREAEVQSPQDEMHAFLAARDFHVAELERALASPRDVDRLLQGTQGQALSAPARSLTREMLLRYLDDAQALPLRGLLARIDDHGLRPDRLAEASGTDLPRVFRRLATLPPDSVGPVGLAICDASGSLVFRKPIAGFDMPRLAGACALWPLYQVMAQPNVPLRMRVRQAGRGDAPVLAMAVAGAAGPAGFGRPALTRMHMLLLPDIPGDPGEVLELGVSCRICPLRDCAARREPSIIAEGF